MTHFCKHEDIIGDMKKDIYGNSNPGMKVEVTTMKNDMKWVKRIGVAIIVLLLGNITTMITIFSNMGGK
jgi:hypothetical protein